MKGGHENVRRAEGAREFAAGLCLVAVESHDLSDLTECFKKVRLLFRNRGFRVELEDVSAIWRRTRKVELVFIH